LKADAFQSARRGRCRRDAGAPFGGLQYRDRQGAVRSSRTAPWRSRYWTPSRKCGGGKPLLARR